MQALGGKAYMANPIEYQGKTYPSFKALHEACAAVGITYACAYTRWKNEIELEAALNTPQEKNTSRAYEVDGIKYKSLKSLSEVAGITYIAAVKRSHRGFSDQEIFYGKVKAKKKSQPVQEEKIRGHEVLVRGTSYINLRAAYDEIQPDVPFNTVRGRLRYGWTVAEALGAESRIDRRKTHDRVVMLTVDGQQMNATEASDKYGVPLVTILDRLKRGSTPEQAVGVHPIKKGTLLKQSDAYSDRKTIERKSYSVNGKVYNTVPALAEDYGLCPKLVYNRMRDNGWSAEKAVSAGKYEAVEIEGLSFKSGLNAWEEIGETSYSSFQSRKRAGFDLEICLGLMPLPEQEKYELNGVSYSNIEQVATAYGLSETQLRYRLQSLSIEEAVEYIPSNGKYCETYFERNPEFATSIGFLYFVVINTPDGKLHKIGITRRPVSRRFANASFDLIQLYQGGLENAYRLEQLVLSTFSHLRYRADDSFDGKTETFLLIPEEVLDFIRLLKREHETYDLSAVAP
jgi:hypothetical protein